jgi:serine/threonine protein kinase
MLLLNQPCLRRIEQFNRYIFSRQSRASRFAPFGVSLIILLLCARHENPSLPLVVHRVGKRLLLPAGPGPGGSPAHPQLTMEQYEVLDKLGEGQYGTVYRARSLATASFVALKKIKLQDGDEGVPSSAIREIAFLRELRHPNIVQMLDIIQDVARVYIIFELLDSDLKSYMNLHSPVPLPIVSNFTLQILRGVAYCHAHSILHRDLKPQNLLVINGSVVKLADFGLSRNYGIPLRVYTHEVVTLWSVCVCVFMPVCVFFFSLIHIYKLNNDPYP